jgi:DNA replication protein DnaC
MNAQVETQTPDVEEFEHCCTTHLRRYNGGECPECRYDADRAKAERENASRIRGETQQRRQAALEKSIGAAGIPERYRDYTFDTFPAVSKDSQDRRDEVLSAARSYVNRWPAMRKAGANLIIMGNVGSGKTGLACAIAATIMRGYDATAVFNTAYGVVRHQRDTWGRRGGKTEEEALKDFVDPDLLIIDEIGTSPGGDAEMLMLFEVINGRYAARRPTILLTNLPMDDYRADSRTVTQDRFERPGLRTFLGARILDRLLEGDSQVLRFNWTTLRESTPS